MTEIFADLHNHTIYSDGTCDIKCLVKLVKEKGIKAFSITDHDSIDGIKEAIKIARKEEVIFIPGVEVTIRCIKEYFKGSIHLLLYFDEILMEDDEFVVNVKEVLSKGRGEQLFRERLKNINQFFGPEGINPILDSEVKYDELKVYGNNLSRRHLGIYLRDKYNLSREEVNLIIGNSSPAYVPSGIDILQLTPLLDKYPFVRILAHPAAGSYPENGHYKEVLPPVEIMEKLLKELETIKLDGLEIEYPGHTPQLKEILYNWMDKYKFKIVTGGSDFHDLEERPCCISGISEEQFNLLYDFINKRTENYVNRRSQLNYQETI